MSAVIGQDWRPKTPKELFVMWQAYQLDRWQHTASLTMIHADRKTSYAQVHPYINPAFVSTNKSSRNVQTTTTIPTTPLIPGL